MNLQNILSETLQHLKQLPLPWTTVYYWKQWYVIQRLCIPVAIVSFSSMIASLNREVTSHLKFLSYSSIAHFCDASCQVPPSHISVTLLVTFVHRTFLWRFLSRSSIAHFCDASCHVPPSHISVTLLVTFLPRTFLWRFLSRSSTTPSCDISCHLPPSYISVTFAVTFFYHRSLPLQSEAKATTTLKQTRSFFIFTEMTDPCIS
jgi:hypothetical protein